MKKDSNNKLPLMNKWMGSIVGLAIGDQLGSLVEGKSRGSFERIIDMQDDTFWTDDTSQALCIADSLITKKEFDINDQLDRFSEWLFEGYLSCKDWGYGCGPTARLAITNYKESGIPKPVKDQATNGALMRLSPIPLFYSDNLMEAIAKSGDSSKSTHNNPICIDACRLYGSMIVKALQGKDKESILSYESKLWENNSLDKLIDTIAKGSYAKKNLSEIRGTLNITESIEAALWVFHRSSSFGEGALMAVNLGDDADTTAAIFGQLGGAYYGYSDIPNSWKSKLKNRDLVEFIAKKLYEVKNSI